MDKRRQTSSNEYPNVITSLPEAEVPVKGVRAWILQSEKHQLVFFEMKSATLAPEHSHNYVQWGIVIEGKMELTIDGKTTLLEKGDEYVIPACAKHSARFLIESRIIDFFSEKTRYKPKVV